MDNRENRKGASQNRNVPERHDQENNSYKTLQEALKLVKSAVQGEKEDEIFYDFLISEAPTQEEKKIISDIRDDEKKHYKMFREIYTYYTGEELPQAKQGKYEEPTSYLEGIRKALFGELAAMERYRIIRAGLPDRYYRDMVFEILTDEMKHADKYNYILNMNSMDFDRMKSMQAYSQSRYDVRIRNVDDHRFYNEDSNDEGENSYDEDENSYNEYGRHYNRDDNSDDEHEKSYDRSDNRMDEDRQVEDEKDSQNKKENNPDENSQDENIPKELLDYIDPIVTEAMREAKAGKDLKYLFQKYILIGILIGNGFTGEQGVEQVKVWESTILAG